MKSPTPRLFRFLILFILVLFILGCSLSKSNNPAPTNTSTPESTQTNTQIPSPTFTNSPEPTVITPTVTLATNTPVATPTKKNTSIPDYFTEEFGNDLTNWDKFFTAGDEGKANIFTDDGKLTFELNGTDIYSYLIYTPVTYDDVRLDVEVENRGYNNNSVSLICRYDEAQGWYEFNIANNGLFTILYYDIPEKYYYYITNGGSSSIRTGKDINEYSIECDHKTLMLYINGVETSRLSETRYVLEQGKVGISVSSFNVYPIEVDFESIKISRP